MLVSLDEAERSLARFVGEQRYSLARKKGRSDRIATPTDRIENDVRGALAEMAVAKASGRYWNALVDDPRKHIVTADVGESLHVKAIDKPTNNLIVRPDDPRFGTYVLCLVDGDVTLVGSFPAERIGPQHWRRNLPQPAFLILQKDLLPVSL